MYGGGYKAIFHALPVSIFLYLVASIPWTKYAEDWNIATIVESNVETIWPSAKLTSKRT